MADTVTTQILHDGVARAVLKFTNVSDGTGESAVRKVTAADLLDAPTKVRIERIVYATNGMGVRILWDAATDVLAWVIPENSSDTLDFRDFGGLQPDGVTLTGDILITTNGHTSGDSYSIVLFLRKD